MPEVHSETAITDPLARLGVLRLGHFWMAAHAICHGATHAPTLLMNYSGFRSECFNFINFAAYNATKS